MMHFDPERIAKRRAVLDAEYARLAANVPVQMPVVGDHVIVAAGLLGRGFYWVREEVEVVDVAENSAKVRFFSYEREAHDKWISLVLITDILPRPKGDQ